MGDWSDLELATQKRTGKNGAIAKLQKVVGGRAQIECEATRNVRSQGQGEASIRANIFIRI